MHFLKILLLVCRYVEVMRTLLKNQFGYLIGCIERPEDPPGIRKNLFRQNDTPQNIYLFVYL